MSTASDWERSQSRTRKEPPMSPSRPGRRAVACAAALAAAALVPVPPAHAASTLTMRGADVSTLQRATDLGARYHTASGAQADPLDILASAGVNYVRLRVWNNPRSGYNNAAKVLAYARTVKAKGFKLLVDLHYSDTWADPGVQTKPAAWANHGIATLTRDVHDYTYGLCRDLKAQGTTPDSVQIGNEINVGMLWNDGRVVNNDFRNLAALLRAGHDAVKACNAGRWPT
jgi:arabinogalactan endo-1,4-beta-galactosidase